MTTPLRQQYLQIKKQFPEAIVLFRLGDFYETFDDDAKIVSEVCSIVLTARDMGSAGRVPLAGVPHHAIETYLARLVQAGHKVAIVDQLETAEATGQGRALISRDVTRVVTPGTVVEPNLLQDKANNYLAAVAIQDGRAGIAHADITTGEFAATELDARDVLMELDRLQPAEVLYLTKEARERFPYPTSVVLPLDDEAATRTLLEQFRVASLDGFGLGEMLLATRAAAGILRYLQENQRSALGQLRAVRVYATDAFMTLDAATRRNLELVSALRGGGQKFSLLGILDATHTAMGGRLLRQWLVQPLRDRDTLNARLDWADAFFKDTALRERTRAVLKKIGDVERLTNRVQQGIASPREVRMLGASLEVIPALNQELEILAHTSLVLDPVSEVSEVVVRALVDDPPANLTNGGAIRDGYSAELDSVIHASRNAKDWVAALERTERERSGIKSLKVGYNRVFGYYIEVTSGNLGQVPSDYIRKQTLANAERFITPELKEYEALILNAEERLVELETTLFRSLCVEVAQYAPRLLNTARQLGELDVYAALAEVALRNRYVRPELVEESVIEIQGGRHPVVELRLQDTPFVPNDVKLNADELIHVITGPNMSGKSTFLRQTALIVLMAQIGSFVPAERARLGIVDRIFTRIGAEDAISAGQSTFMVEMVETANILHHCTPRSLVVLDEIGRGTSTYDGIAIARAIIEYMHNHPQARAKTLFATHYHELTELESYLPRVKNYNVAVIEQGDQVVFLHKIVRGGADKSYGIHVARLAGVPRPVVSRAEEILVELENGASEKVDSLPVQLRLFSPDDDLRRELAGLDVMALSPIEALNKLFELQKKASGAREGTGSRNSGKGVPKGGATKSAKG
ncbi:MAG TPA: DNA mismatch repair protein MutS [Anaerolineae bacterium]|nr:DNA mismatch repair protein MutS [Anaerolineae bacterium]